MFSKKGDSLMSLGFYCIDMWMIIDNASADVTFSKPNSKSGLDDSR